MNAFTELTGSARLKTPAFIAIAVAFAAIVGFFIAKEGMIPGFLILVLPALGYFLHFVFKDPRKGLIFTFTINFYCSIS